MSVQRHEYGAKGGVLRDPMTWTKNADGSYHIVITTRRVGTHGQVLTYEYDWPSIPVSHALAVATAERMWRAEHPAPKRTAAQTTEATAQGLMGFGGLSVIVSVLAFINAALGGPSLRVAIVSLAIGVSLLAVGAMISRSIGKPVTPVNRPATAAELAAARARGAELMKEQRRSDEAK